MPPARRTGARRFDRVLELARRSTTSGWRTRSGSVEERRAEGWQVAYDEDLGAGRLPLAIETAFSRVAQAALGNRRKHAQTTRARVALEHRGRVVRLEVQDWAAASRPPPPDGWAGWDHG